MYQPTKPTKQIVFRPTGKYFTVRRLEAGVASFHADGCRRQTKCSRPPSDWPKNACTAPEPDAKSFPLLLFVFGALLRPPRRAATTAPVVSPGQTLLRNAPCSSSTTTTFARTRPPSSSSSFRTVYGTRASVDLSTRGIRAAYSLFGPFPRWAAAASAAALSFADAFAFCCGVGAAAPGCYQLGRLASEYLGAGPAHEHVVVPLASPTATG